MHTQNVKTAAPESSERCGSDISCTVFEDSTITASLVSENRRLAFLPALFGRLFMQGEQIAYNWLKKNSENYNGAYWQFYNLSGGGHYLAPQVDEPIELAVISNYYQGSVSGDAAGIIATMYALNALIHHCYEKGDDALQETLTRHYYKLREFAGEHAEGCSIFGAID